MAPADTNAPTQSSTQLTQSPTQITQLSTQMRSNGSLSSSPLTTLPSTGAIGFSHQNLPVLNGLQETAYDVRTGRTETSSLALSEPSSKRKAILELRDGTILQGTSFGAEKSAAGELVFQTGMVGYPESITDPSYRGQILVVTFPLVGNYGVPSRDARDGLLEGLAAHFESDHIHITALIVAAYSGEDFSHYLAISSLGTWLKEQGVPALYGVDTRSLTKKIREQGSMLGRLLLESKVSASMTNGCKDTDSESISNSWREKYASIDWIDPNTTNLVAAGMTT